MSVEWFVVAREGGQAVFHCQERAGLVAGFQRHISRALMSDFGGYDRVYERTDERVTVVAIKRSPGRPKQAMKFTLLKPQGASEWLGLPADEWMPS